MSEQEKTNINRRTFIKHTGYAAGIAAMTSVLPGSVNQAQAAQYNGRGTRAVMLGTGTPNPDPERSGPCVAVIAGQSAYIVDCGPGCVRRAAAGFRRGIRQLAPHNLTTAFITHLHSDHTAGYPDLILTPAVLGRKKALEVYGPGGTKKMTEHIMAAYSEDISVRINGLESAKAETYAVNAHEFKPGVIYKDENAVVSAFKVNHGSWKQAYGFRFKTADRTIVISGDTAPYPEIEKDYQGCDVLIHEVYSDTGLKRRSPGRQKYHSGFHTSGIQLGKIAAKVKPGILVLYHQLLWQSSKDTILNEIRQNYQGKIIYANDLDVI